MRCRVVVGGAGWTRDWLRQPRTRSRVQTVVGGRQDGAVVVGADPEHKSFAVAIEQPQLAQCCGYVFGDDDLVDGVGESEPSVAQIVSVALVDDETLAGGELLQAAAADGPPLGAQVDPGHREQVERDVRRRYGGDQPPRLGRCRDQAALQSVEESRPSTSISRSPSIWRRLPGVPACLAVRVVDLSITA